MDSDKNLTGAGEAAYVLVRWQRGSHAYFSCAPRLDLPPWNGGFRALLS